MGYVACEEKWSFKPQDGNFWQHGSVENVSGGRWRCTTCGLHTAKANVTHTHTHTHRASPLYSLSASIRAVSHAVPWLCPAFSSHLPLTQKLDDWILCCVSMVKIQMSFLLIYSVKFTSSHVNVQREENKQETSLSLYLLSNCFPCFLTMPKCSQSANMIQFNVTVKFGQMCCRTH